MALSFLPYFSAYFKLKVCSEALRKKPGLPNPANILCKMMDEK
jgi:hypothetical protein